MDATLRFEINELRSAASRAGDNMQAAICEIAANGELSVESIDRLTEMQFKELTKLFADVEAPYGWKRADAIAECERVIADNAE